MPFFENEHGRYYEIPETLLGKYLGCGCGQIVVENETNEVIDLAHVDEADWVISTKNPLMTTKAGEVINKTSATTTYRVNFRCAKACFF